MTFTETLRAELVADPAGVGYAADLEAGNDGLLADALNTPRGSPVLGMTTVADVQAALHSMATGDGVPVWLIIEDAVAGLIPDMPPQIRGACRMVAAVANAKYTNLDLGLPAVGAALGALRLAGILTAEQHAAVLALGYRVLSRAEVLFGVGHVVSVDDAAAARLSIPQGGGE